MESEAKKQSVEADHDGPVGLFRELARLQAEGGRAEGAFDRSHLH